MAIGEHIFLVDPLVSGQLQPLTDILSNSAVLSIMHSASEDLEALSPILPHGLGSLFDTQLAAAFAGLGPGVGYQKLVSTLLGIELEKTETRSDWLKRPLTPEQLNYAAQDVLHLAPIHAILTAKLKERGYETWHAEDCARMVRNAHEKAIDSEPHLQFRRAADWSPHKQALLKRILLWRETTARTIDQPRPWILDDTHSFDLAEQPPQSIEVLSQKTRGLRALHGDLRVELLQVLNQPISDSELELTPIPPELTSADKRLLRTLKEIVVSIATELNLPEGLLCARRHLEALLTTRTWPVALEGWRRTLLYDAFMARLVGSDHGE